MYQYCGKCLRKLTSRKSMTLGFCGKCRKPVCVGQLDFSGKVLTEQKGNSKKSRVPQNFSEALFDVEFMQSMSRLSRRVGRGVL
jgi:hypothetical protein